MNTRLDHDDEQKKIDFSISRLTLRKYREVRFAKISEQKREVQLNDKELCKTHKKGIYKVHCSLFGGVVVIQLVREGFSSLTTNHLFQITSPLSHTFSSLKDSSSSLRCRLQSQELVPIVLGHALQ